MHAGGFTPTIVGLADKTITTLRDDISQNIGTLPNQKWYAAKMVEATNLRRTLGYMLEGTISISIEDEIKLQTKIQLQILTLQEITSYLRLGLCLNLSQKNQTDSL